MKCTRRILSYCCKNNSNLEEFGTIGVFLKPLPSTTDKRIATYFFFFPCVLFFPKKKTVPDFPLLRLRSPWLSLRCERGAEPRGAARCLRASSASASR